MYLLSLLEVVEDVALVENGNGLSHSQTGKSTCGFKLDVTGILKG